MTKMMTEIKMCEICGKSAATETHHLIFGNALRRLADEDGLTLDLCGECHRCIHTVPMAGTVSKMLGQLMWEKAHNNDREAFRRRYGRSWW